MLWWLLCAVLVAADRFTKLWAVSDLKGAEAKNFIPKVLQFSYVENRGIAFGLMQNKHWLIITINLVVLAICAWITRDFVKKNKIYITKTAAPVQTNTSAKLNTGNFINTVSIKSTT